MTIWMGGGGAVGTSPRDDSYKNNGLFTVDRLLYASTMACICHSEMDMSSINAQPTVTSMFHLMRWWSVLSPITVIVRPIAVEWQCWKLTAWNIGLKTIIIYHCDSTYLWGSYIKSVIILKTFEDMGGGRLKCMLVWCFMISRHPPVHTLAAVLRRSLKWSEKRL